MKFALASDLYVDSYPDDQQIDWHLVRQWTGVDVLVICGNISDSFERTKSEVLAAREAFDHVFFVGGMRDCQAGFLISDPMEALRHFSMTNEGIHYLDGGAGVVLGHTLVCGVSGWQKDQAATLCRRVGDAAADQSIGEIVLVTHAPPHPDAHKVSGGGVAGPNGVMGSVALAPIWSDCMDGGKLTVWCYGHALHPLDFTDNGVRFVCNPRGHFSTAAGMPYTVHLIDTSALTDEMW